MGLGTRINHLIFQLTLQPHRLLSDIPRIHQPTRDSCILFFPTKFSFFASEAGKLWPLVLYFILVVGETLYVRGKHSYYHFPEPGYISQAGLELIILLRTAGMYHHVQCFGHFSGPQLVEISRAVQN